MANSKKTEVVAAEKSEGALPAGFDMSEMEADAASNPSMTAGDVALPYIAVLQDMSPQVKRHEAAYIEGSEAGMFFDNAAEEVFEGRNVGIMVVPCYY